MPIRVGKSLVPFVWASYSELVRGDELSSVAFLELCHSSYVYHQLALVQETVRKNAETYVQIQQQWAYQSDEKTEWQSRQREKGGSINPDCNSSSGSQWFHFSIISEVLKGTQQGSQGSQIMMGKSASRNQQINCQSNDTPLLPYLRPLWTARRFVLQIPQMRYKVSISFDNNLITLISHMIYPL